MPDRIDMGGAGFEPAKAMPPDLQSGPFGRLGIHPVRFRLNRVRSGHCEAAPIPTPKPGDARYFNCLICRILDPAELAVRLELTTVGLQNRSSAN